MKFSKEKMIERITREGRMEMIDEIVVEMMDNLDGQVASDRAGRWMPHMIGKPVMWVIGKDGLGEYVLGEDCV